MAKPKSVPRGDQFERDYLLRMGLVKPAARVPSEADQLRHAADGGMGAVAPMVTRAVASKLARSRS